MHDAAAEGRGERWLGLAWAGAGVCACLLVLPFEPNLLEEGILLHVAQRLAHGERLYQDVLAFTGPLPFEALALLFRLFGEEIVVGRVAVALLHGAATAAGFALARRSGAGPFAHAAAACYAAAPLLLFPLFGIFYYTTLAFHLSLLAGWAALSGSRARSLLAGVLVAGVALCKQPIGAALAVSLAAALALGASGPARERTARLAAYAAGGIAVAVVTLAAWALAGTLPAAWNALLVLPASLGETFEAPFPNLWPPGEFAPEIAKSQTFYLPYFYILTQGIFVEPGRAIQLVTQVAYAVPIAALVGTAVRRAFGPTPPAFWLHGALLSTWLVNLYPRTDWGHLVHVLPPAVAHLAILLGPPRRSGWLARSGAVVLVALVALGAGWAHRQLQRDADRAILAPRVPLRPVSLGLRGPPVRRVIDFLLRHAEPGDPIFVARAEPLLYFATETSNPTPYPGVIPGLGEEQARTILAALERTRFVVMSDVDQPAMTYYRDELPEVQAELERRFQLPEEFTVGEPAWLLVLEPGPDRGATAIDLVERASDASAFWRDGAGEVIEGVRFEDRVATRQNRRPLGFTLGPRGGGLDFELSVPPGAVFQADAGLVWVVGLASLYQAPRGSTVRVSIGEGGTFTPLVETPVMVREIDPRRWTPLEADLSAWAGRRVTLRIELFAGEAPKPHHIGFVGSPRIAVRAP